MENFSLTEVNNAAALCLDPSQGTANDLHACFRTDVMWGADAGDCCT